MHVMHVKAHIHGLIIVPLSYWTAAPDQFYDRTNNSLNSDYTHQKMALKI